MLLEGGLDCHSALRVLSRGEDSKFRQLALYLMGQLENGNSLSGAMHNHKDFSLSEFNAIHTGEHTGSLISVIRGLSEYFKRLSSIGRSLKKALTYPLFVMVCATAVLVFLLSYVVPIFSRTFEQFDAELPVATEFIIATGEWVQSNAVVIVCCICVVALGAYSMKKYQKFNLVLVGFGYQLPVLGPVLRELAVSRFCQSMSLLLNSGVNLVAALNLTKDSLTNYKMGLAVTELARSVERGQSLSKGIKEITWLDYEFETYVKVAEEGGNLGNAFEHLAEVKMSRAEAMLFSLTQLIEPALIVLVALIVAIILISMYLPLFELSTVMRA